MKITHTSIFTNSLLVTVILSLSVCGCYDPTQDSVDAGSGTAKKEQQVEVADSDLEFSLDSDNCDIKWTGSNSAGMTPHGFFYELAGKIVVDGKTKQLKHFEVDIEMESVKAMNAALTTKLKTKGFFQVDEYPKSRFAVTAVSEPRDGDPEGTTQVLEGNLQLRDVTKSIKIPVAVNVDEAKGVVTLTSEFKINRKDYGVIYEISIEDALIRDEVLINLDIEAELKK